MISRVDLKIIAGEALGTGVLVFLGCGTVGIAVTKSLLPELWQVALLFGLAVTVGIFASRNLCSAHLNPAVSLAFTFAGKMTLREFFCSVTGQFIGAFVGAAFLYLLLSSTISDFETEHQIVRGTSESVKSAMMFGEYFPNPGMESFQSLSVTSATIAEFSGTLILIFSIFILTQYVRIPNILIPFIIGLVVMGLIILIAPYTQGGFNPARDLSPRLFSYFSGWGKVVFMKGNVMVVYVVGPMLAGTMIGLLNRILRKKTKSAF